ncbi:hypothetical protein P0F65_11015 [Sphingomonas sp. I4]
MTVTTSRRFTFHAKLIGAVALIGLAHLFFYGEEPGWTLGGFALAWTIMLVLLRADVRASRSAQGAVAVAVLFGLTLVDDPGPLKWLLFGVSIGMATLLPLRRFDDAPNGPDGCSSTASAASLSRSATLPASCASAAAPDGAPSRWRRYWSCPCWAARCS